MKKYYIFLIVSIFLIGFVSAGFGFDKSFSGANTNINIWASEITNISEARDTDIDGTQTNGQILAWDSSIAKWKPNTFAGGGDFLTANFQSAFNSNYSNAIWSYNQTIASGGSGSSYNETYATWLPNYTLYKKFWYNMTGAGGGDGTDNASWNQSFADTLYSDIVWGYNMSDGSYNATYDKWAYNGSGWLLNTYGNNWYNHTLAVENLYSKWFYNQSDGSYNSTYNTWAYNMSDGSYNVTYVGLINNDSYLTTYNTTYATWSYNQSSWLISTYGINWYNHTLAIEGLYSKWFYNQTDGYEANTDTNYWGLNGTSIYNNSVNVGIGTGSPKDTYPNGFNNHVDDRVIEINSISTSGDAGLFIRRSDKNIGLDLWSESGGTGTSYLDSRINNDNGGFIFRTKASGTPVNVMRILGSGYVGIGTTTPTHLLNVNGNANITNNLTIGGGLIYTNATASFWD